MENKLSDHSKRFLNQYERQHKEPDNPSWDEIEREVDFENFQPDVHVSEQLSPDEQETLQLAKEFVVDVSKVFQEESRRLLAEYYNSDSPFGQKIIEFIKDKGFDVPKFSVFDQEQARDFLKNLGYEVHEFEDDNLLLTFQLPKPLAKFWWKGNDLREAKKTAGSTRLWGNFYFKLMPIVHQRWDQMHYDEQLFFYRVNMAGIHDEQEYYYLWEISNRPLPGYKRVSEWQ